LAGVLLLQWAEGHNWWGTTDFVPNKEVKFKILLKKRDGTYDWDAGIGCLLV
jgi:hypothetical protein